MIRLIDQSNRARYPYLLDRLFRFRHDIFVKERGWKEFDRAGLYETDRFDTNDAAYLIAVDDAEEVVGCCRLTSSLEPTLTQEHFGFLVEGQIPQRGDVLDLTRFAVAKGQRRTQTYPELLAGVQEYCLEQGAIGATSIIRTFRMPLLQAAGMNLTPLGLPQTYQDENLVAVLFNASEDILADVYRHAGLRYPVLQRDPSTREKVRA
jgi:acyl-homoserine lactone synthase